MRHSMMVVVFVTALMWGCTSAPSPDGMVFYTTVQPEAVHRFYTDTLGFETWQHVGQVRILHRGGFFIGFHESETADTAGLVSIVKEDFNGVDGVYGLLKSRALFEPRVDSTYGIYHFLARDPEHRLLEIQAFLNK